MPTERTVPRMKALAYATYMLYSGARHMGYGNGLVT